MRADYYFHRLLNMERLRQAGRFITKSKLSWRQNVLKSHKKLPVDPPDELPSEPPKYSLEGRRVVELNVLSEGLWCPMCQLCLSLKNTVGEEIRGLASVLRVKCLKCNMITDAHTSKSANIAKNVVKMYDVNCKMAVGKYPA